MDNGQTLTVLFLIGIGVLIYKVCDLSAEKNKLKKQLTDAAKDFKDGADEITDAVNKSDEAIESLVYRLCDSAKTSVDIYKHTAKLLPPAERKKMARKIARDCVSSTTQHKLPELIQGTNEKKLTYYSVLFPEAADALLNSGLDADIDKSEIVDIITETILKSK